MAKIRHGYNRPHADPVLPQVDALVADLRPSDPLLCLRPVTIVAAATRFVAAFPGDVLYAVKCNPEPRVLRALWAGGIRHFDCASLAEVKLVRALLPAAEVHFMHPVKARPAIAEAFDRWQVRDFALDSPDELAKILQETVPVGLVGEPPTLGLFVRLALPKGGAVYDLSGKFGAAPDNAARLLRAARPYAARLGITFHVGSQCLDPAAYTRALALAGEVIAVAGVPVEIVDVGGGFPVRYPDMTPPPLAAFIDAIELGAAALPSGIRLWAEPGRALVADGGSVVAQVQLRRDNALYVNDGVYGNLSDAGALGFCFPVRRVRLGDSGEPAGLADFILFGPTCDSADRMKGPFRLPTDMREGDWIEFGQLGAYGACLSSRFNGFGAAGLIEVADPPMLPPP
ncbi:MAG TPA: type III PLP-dependent enzyme [Stellaceae bacterium]|nr:type III PLP-dependent enzyme [Stellaceae bacterium]